jgi:bacterial/archaeal transporter family-2 protein
VRVIQVLAIFGGVLCGAVLATQVGVNLQLSSAVGNPVTSTLCSFIVGAIGLFVYVLIVRAPLPPITAFTQIAAWKWTGGLLGATYVLLTIAIGPRLGAAALLALVVTGQMIAAMVLDQNGWLGFAQHSVNLWRLLGAALLVTGTVLILRY